jgi:hypothetical protein
MNMNNIKFVRITEGLHEVEQVIVIATVENDIVDFIKILLDEYSRLFHRYGNLDGEGFVKYLQSIYGENALQLVSYNNETIFENGRVI